MQNPDLKRHPQFGSWLRSLEDLFAARLVNELIHLGFGESLTFSSHSSTLLWLLSNGFANDEEGVLGHRRGDISHVF